MPTNWCPDVVPNNAGGVEYEVLIAGANSIVYLNFSPVVRSLTLENCAKLEADVIDFTAVLGPVRIDTGGRYIPRPGAPTHTATIFADTITLDSTRNFGGLFILEEAMSATTSGDVTVNGLTVPSACEEELCLVPPRGGTSPPVLKIVRVPTSRSAADRGGPGPVFDVGGSLTLRDRVRTVNDEGTVNLAGDFANQSNSPDCFDWDNGTLTLTNPSSPQVFEVAGEDRGASITGFVDNFALGTLSVNPGVVVDFFDTFDNQEDGQSACEVLYVRILFLGAGSTIRLHGCNIYYQCLYADPTATVDRSEGGDLIQVGSCATPCICGDIDESGGPVNLIDFASFAICFGRTVAASPQCLCADLDANGTVNLLDFGTFSLLFGLASTGSPPNCHVTAFSTR